MVRESCAVARPVKFGHPFQVRPRLAAKCRHRPYADVAAVRPVLPADPESDQRAIRREPQSSDRRISQPGNSPMGQIVELTRSDLCNPYVCGSVSVRQKGHEMAVTE